MKQTLTVSVAALGLLVLSSRSGKLGSLSADNFTVTPAPLEVVGDAVPRSEERRVGKEWRSRWWPCD